MYPVTKLANVLEVETSIMYPPTPELVCPATTGSVDAAHEATIEFDETFDNGLSTGTVGAVVSAALLVVVFTLVELLDVLLALSYALTLT